MSDPRHKNQKMKSIIRVIIISFYAINAQSLDINALRMAQLNQVSNSMIGNEISNVKQSNPKVIIEKTIDQNKYIVGPGDEFILNIITSEDISTYTLVVSPSGKILIPSFGIVNIDGLTLSYAIKEIKKSILKLNPNAKIHVLLSDIREFNVKVIGQLQKPGYYIATPVSRVSDIYKEIISNIKYEKEEKEIDQVKIETVNTGFNEKIKSQNKKRKYPELSRRNIKIIRNNDSLQVDLIKFGSSGQDIYNPLIQQEDVIHIPLLLNQITIFGGINIPGKYELVENENLADIISLGGGFRPDANKNNIEITRFKSPTDKFTFNVNISTIDTLTVYPEDHIMIRYLQDYKRSDLVNIEGEVQYPGYYSIEVGKTKIGDIIHAAGGYTNKADKNKLYINNKSISGLPDKEKNRILIIPEENRSDEERAYIKARMLTKKGTIESTSINHAKTLMQLTLTKNDEIIIPQNFNYIEVLGAVLKPGRYPFNETLDFQSIIELAGGLTNTATKKKFLIKAGTGQRLKFNKNLDIENGDTIFIPDKIEYNSWTIFKDILTTLGNVAAIIVVIQNAL